MKLPKSTSSKCLCDQCVGLCCRYFALAIDKPKTRQDFEYIRWYLLHEDAMVFVEDGDWYLQINRKCRALQPDNRCGIYEKRPAICRSYKTDNCDFHGDEYEYEHIFVEPDEIARFAEEYLAARRKRRAAGKRRAKASARKKTPLRVRRSRSARRPGVPVPILKSA